MSYTHPKNEQARIIGQIQKCYTNAPSLLTPTINQVEFEKALKEEKVPFFFEEVIKSYSTQVLKDIEKEEDSIKKSEILTESSQQLSSLEKISVVFDNMTKGIYVDAIDISTNKYKDNAINRKLDRVGEVANGRTEIVKQQEK